MTLLQLIQAFTQRTGLGTPPAAASSGDDQVTQYVGLMNEVLDDLEERKAYTMVQATATHTLLGAELQGAIRTIAAGYKKLIPNTMNNITSGRRILGPAIAELWQADEAGLESMAESYFRLIGGNLYLKPAATADEILQFEYQTDQVVMDTEQSPTAYKKYFTLDTDTCLYPDKLMIAGLRWAWKAEKGLRYAEQFRAYETCVANLSSTDGGSETLSMDGGGSKIMGVNVPETNWDLS